MVESSKRVFPKFLRLYLPVNLLKRWGQMQSCQLLFFLKQNLFIKKVFIEGLSQSGTELKSWATMVNSFPCDLIVWLGWGIVINKKLQKWVGLEEICSYTKKPNLAILKLNMKGRHWVIILMANRYWVTVMGVRYCSEHVVCKNHFISTQLFEVGNFIFLFKGCES